MHLVGFITRIYHDARSLERQIELLYLICYKCSGMDSIKIATDSQANIINKYKNLRQRLLQCRAYSELPSWRKLKLPTKLIHLFA